MDRGGLLEDVPEFRKESKHVFGQPRGAAFEPGPVGSSEPRTPDAADVGGFRTEGGEFIVDVEK